jgi:hypothetical protein
MAAYRAKPPIGRRIDYGSPLLAGRKAVAICPFWDGAGALADASRSRRASASGTVTWGNSRDGKAATFGTTSLFSFGSNGLAHGNGDVSMIFRGIVPTLSSSKIAIRIAGSSINSYHFGWNASLSKVAFTLTGVIDVSSAFTLTAGRFISLGVSYKKSVSAYFDLYDFDAGTRTTGTTLNNNTPGTSATNSAIGGFDTSAGLNWNAAMSFAAVVTGLWSRADFTRLHADPWQLFQRRRLPVPLWGSAAVGGNRRRRVICGASA